MQRTFERFPDDPAAGRVVTRIIDALCDIEGLCYHRPVESDGSSGGKAAGSAPKANRDAMAVLTDATRMLKDTLDGKPNLTGITAKLAKLVAKRRRERAVKVVAGVDVSVVGESMPQDAVSQTLAKSPEERSADAKRAIASRWAKRHAN